MGHALAGGAAVLDGDVEAVGLYELLDGGLHDAGRSPQVAELVVCQLVHHDHRPLRRGVGEQGRTEREAETRINDL